MQPSQLSIPLHLRVALSNWVARTVSISVQLVTLPLLTRHLGADEFAAYAIVTSLITWYMLADPGAGSAAQNLISKSRATNLPADVFVVNGIAYSLIPISLALGSLLLAAPFLANYLLGRFSGVASEKATALVLVSGCAFLCAVLGSICTKMLYALGKGVFANALTTISSVLSLFGVLVVLHFLPRQDWLLGAAISYSLPMGLIGIGLAVVLYVRAAPTSHMANATQVRLIAKNGLGFWLLAAIGAVVFNLDYIILSNLAEPSRISEYNILQRIFGTAMTFYGGLLAASWPQWAEALTTGNSKVVALSITSYLKGAFIALVVGAVVLYVLRKPLFEFFLPDAVIFSDGTTIFLFALYIASRIWTDTYSTILLAQNDTSVFLRYTPVQAALSIALQLLLARHLSINGVLLGMTLAAMATSVWILPKHAARILNN